MGGFIYILYMDLGQGGHLLSAISLHQCLSCRRCEHRGSGGAVDKLHERIPLPDWNGLNVRARGCVLICID